MVTAPIFAQVRADLPDVCGFVHSSLVPSWITVQDLYDAHEDVVVVSPWEVEVLCHLDGGVGWCESASSM